LLSFQDLDKSSLVYALCRRRSESAARLALLLASDFGLSDSQVGQLVGLLTLNTNLRDIMPLQQQQQQLFYGPLSGISWVSRYQKKHLPTHTYPDHQSFFVSFLHLP